MSTQVLPAGASTSSSRAPSSFSAPRPTWDGPARTSTLSASRTTAPDLVAGTPFTRTRPAITRAWAFSRDSARPWPASQRARRGPRAAGAAALGTALHDEARESPEGRGVRAERREGALRFLEERAREGARALEAVQAHVRGLARGRVLARGLAELLRA